jgi:Carboxypeptidase regulatory-like domain
VSRCSLLVAPLLVVSCGSDIGTPPVTPAPASSPNSYVVSGAVRDSDGVRLQGAHVFVGGDAFSVRQGAPVFNTSTDASGVFRGSLPAGIYIAEADHPGYETAENMNVQVAGPTVLNFTLHLGIKLSGSVMEAGAGLLNDVVVEIISGPNTGLSTLTGHPVPGVYLMQHVMPGDFTVRASKIGYDSVEQTVHAAADMSSLDFTLNVRSP